MNEQRICARCDHFTLEGGKPDEGIGVCLAYGDNNPEPLVRWDKHFTVLYRRAPNMPKREQWISARKRAEEEGNNAAATA